MLMGTYERAGVPWSPRDRRPGTSARICCPTTSSASRPALAVGFRAFSRRSASAGIKKVVNGPFTFAPGRQSAGRAGAGASRISGWPAASWPGSARAAASAWRCRTGWSTAIPAPMSGAWTWRATAIGRRSRYTNAKVRENYSRRFSIRFPNEELPAARPLRTTPIYEQLARASTPCSATTAGSSIRSGSRRPARSGAMM